MFPWKSCLWRFLSSLFFSLYKGLCGLPWHVYGWRSCRVELVREGNEGARMRFLICLMSHNRERWAWKHCAVKQQHSTVTNLECRVSFRHCWLSLLPLSLSCQSKTSRQRKWDRKMQELMSVGRQDAEKKKKESRRWVSDSLQSVYPMPAWAWLHPLSAAARHTCINPVRVCMHVGHCSTQPQLDYNHQSGSNTHDNNWLCLFSLWHLRNHLNVAEPTVWLVTMQMYRFYCSFKYGNPTATNNQYAISNSSHTMWLVWYSSFT